MANDDLISRQAAIDAICEHGTDLERRGITVIAVVYHKQATVDLLENLPSAERRGRWIKTKDLFFNPDGSGFFYGRRCSSCTEISANATNYCPNCGARMEAE